MACRVLQKSETSRWKWVLIIISQYSWSHGCWAAIQGDPASHFQTFVSSVNFTTAISNLFLQKKAKVGVGSMGLEDESLLLQYIDAGGESIKSRYGKIKCRSFLLSSEYSSFIYFQMQEALREKKQLEKNWQLLRKFILMWELFLKSSMVIQISISLLVLMQY